MKKHLFLLPLRVTGRRGDSNGTSRRCGGHSQPPRPSRNRSLTFSDTASSRPRAGRDVLIMKRDDRGAIDVYDLHRRTPVVTPPAPPATEIVGGCEIYERGAAAARYLLILKSRPLPRREIPKFGRTPASGEMIDE
ncbi:hypothetical protein EVAR_31639_1 [Eumeta japonica]|uniref:Uncharacterized protein n=1 Tax=Eumeta variegata TaxID=151549 RepID=A0A4C1W2A9_EUMVA|nr:hypothetical protein EVAR_31639_1 [Eumeta japonica]